MRDDHFNGVFEYDFDFHSYIEKQLRLIDDIDERKYAKKVLLEGMEKMIQCMEERYDCLEKRIYEEMELSDNLYEIVMTIIKRQDFDPTNATLFPVVEEDLDEKAWDELGGDAEKIHVETIYLKLPDQEGRRFETQRQFTGYAVIDGKECIARFYVEKAVRYRKQMEQMYQLFQDNQVAWRTVNTGYLDKFYDVFLDLDSLIGLDSKAVLERAEVYYGEFEDSVWREYMPVWNMERIKFHCSRFMVPCLDGVYFEHEFLLKGMDAKDGYLIEFNEDILEIRHEMGKIIIKARVETYENWSAFHLVQSGPTVSLGYDQPFLSNRRKDSFLRRYAEHTGVMLMTKADLFRRITELDIGNYIEICGYEICDKAERYTEGAGMNWFVQDELFPMDSRRVLLLKFKEVSRGNYLNDAMVRFAVSQIQMEVNEYKCVGVIE